MLTGVSWTLTWQVLSSSFGGRHAAATREGRDSRLEAPLLMLLLLLLTLVLLQLLPGMLLLPLMSSWR